jgi:hypothetical protein
MGSHKMEIPRKPGRATPLCTGAGRIDRARRKKKGIPCQVNKAHIANIVAISKNSIKEELRCSRQALGGMFLVVESNDQVMFKVEEKSHIG